MPYHHPTRARPQRIPGVARLLAACLLVCLWGASAGPAHAQARQATRTLEVAQVLPHSGPLANVGKEIHTITEAAFTDFNRSQAELQLRLLAADDGNVAQRSNELAAAMPRDIVAYLSCFGTVGCLAQQKAASVRGVPLIGPMAGAAPLRGPRSAMSYAVRASATRELQTLLTYMRTSGLQQVAVLVQDDGFGRAYADELRRQIPRAGDIGFDVHVFKPDAPAYQAVATRMQQRSPNALLLLANAAHSTGFLHAWRETQALPFVFNALKINSTLALISAIVAEFFGSPIVGLGFRISAEVARMNVDVVWAAITLAALAGSLFYGAVALAERAATGVVEAMRPVEAGLQSSPWVFG